jgi:dehydrogenase/reductase SDR family member 12
VRFTRVLDDALDRSVVLGYTKIGSRLRRMWWPADPGPKAMAGKRVLVTGATAGIGEGIARKFAELDATVHLLGRNAEKVRHSAGAIRRAVPGAMVIDEVCDVSDLDAVRAWCDDLSGRIDELHAVVHNAGAMPKQRIETPQGHETQLACHVLGPHLMTERLLPLLRDAKGASVVFMSSGGMYATPSPASGRYPQSVDDMESKSGDYEGVRVYARTKRMQVVLAAAWAHRLSGDDIRVESMHPGWVGTPGVADALPLFRVVTRPLLRDTADGADTAVWLVATRPESESGHFWHDRAQRPTTFGWQRSDDPERVAQFLDAVSTMTGTTSFRADTQEAHHE